MIGMNDISAMKISAAGTRGNEAKDFVDIYYLLQYISFEKMVSNFRKKYHVNDILHYLRSIIYFDEVGKRSWDSIKYIKDKISGNEIKERLTDEVITYEKNFLLNSGI